MIGGKFLRKPFIAVRFCLLIILLAQVVSSANSPDRPGEKTLTDEDKSEIIKSVLERELKDREEFELRFKTSNFPRGFKEDVGDQYLATENIDFFRLPANLAKHFKLIRLDELKQRRLNRELLQCFVFKEFTADDEKVLVKVSVIYTQYFFGGYLDAKRELVYEYRKVSEHWEGKPIKS